MAEVTQVVVDFSDVPVIELLINVGLAVHVDDPLVTLESDTGAVKERGTNREVARPNGAEAAAA